MDFLISSVAEINASATVVDQPQSEIKITKSFALPRQPKEHQEGDEEDDEDQAEMEEENKEEDDDDASDMDEDEV